MKKAVFLKLLSICTAFALLLCCITAATVSTSADPMPDNTETLLLDEIKTVTIDEPGKIAYFSFTPSVTAKYLFRSMSETTDTYGYIYDGDILIADNGGHDMDSNFGMDLEMSADITYTLVAKLESDTEVGVFDIVIKEIPSITITHMPNITEYLEGCYDPFSVDLSGIEARISYANGDFTDWSYDDDGFFINNEEVFFYEDQETQGKVYITYGAAQTSFNFTILPNPVSSIELITGTSRKYIYNVEGHTDRKFNRETNEYEEFFRYYADTPTDAVIQINYSDNRPSVTAHVGDVVDDYTVEWNDNQANIPWMLSDNNTSIISYMGRTVNLPIAVIEDAISSIELVSGTAKTYFENCGGSIKTRYNEQTNENEDYYHYDTILPTDAIIKINYSDNTYQTAHVGDTVDNQTIHCSEMQSETPWTVGSTNYMEIEYMGKTVNLPITVLANPVSSIELISGTSDKYYENCGGTWLNRTNPENGTPEPYYSYYVNMPSDAVIQINYSDNRPSVTAHVWDMIDGYQVEWDSNQQDNPWTLGGNNNILITYMGRSVNLPVTIEPDIIESIELVKGTETKIFENIDGYYASEWNTETSQYEQYFYYITPQITDAEIKINYKDGTSKTAHINEMIDGDMVSFSDRQSEYPWHLGENTSPVITYRGKTVSLPITVSPNPVESIEVLTGTSFVYYENAVGHIANYLNPETNQDEEYYSYDLQGHEDVRIRINYTDGTHKDANINSSVDGQMISLTSNQSSSPWKLGSDNYATVMYMDKTAEFSVTVVSNPVSGISIIEMPDRLQYVVGAEDGSVNLGGLVIEITYTDNTKKNVDLDECGGIFEGHNFTAEAPAYSIGENSVKVIYLGKDVSYNVTGVENPLISVQITNIPEQVIFIEDVGFYNDYTGLEADFTFNDNSVHHYVYGDDYNYIGAAPRVYANSFMGNPEIWIDFLGFYDSFSPPRKCLADFISQGDIASVNTSDTEITVPLDFEIRKFTPTENGKYHFEGMLESGDDISANLEIYDADGNMLFTGYDEENSYNFLFEAELNANTDYYALFTRYATNDSSSHIIPFEISNVIMGDANDDGSVDIRDLVHLKKHLCCGGALNNTGAVDFDSNGTVNALDLALLQKVLIGIRN